MKRYKQRKVFWGRMDIFVEVFGIGLFPCKGALAINIDWWEECSSLFRGSSLMSIVDICGCFGNKNLGNILDNNFYEKYIWPKQDGDKFPSETGLLADIPFIFANNVIIKGLKYCKKCHILLQDLQTSGTNVEEVLFTHIQKGSCVIPNSDRLGDEIIDLAE